MIDKIEDLFREYISSLNDVFLVEFTALKSTTN